MVGWNEGRSYVEGWAASVSTQEKLLLVGHSSSLFGAERSLGDIIGAAVLDGFPVVATVPREGPAAELYRALGADVRVVKTRAWRGSRHRGPLGAIRLLQCALDVLRFIRLIRLVQPVAVVTNTSVTPSAAVAAAFANVPHLWILREPLRDSSDQHSLIPSPLLARFVFNLSAHR